MAQRILGKQEKFFSEEPISGMFWNIDGSLLSCPFIDGSVYPGAVAESGNTYNHARLWTLVKPQGCNRSYQYYPRGRVEITRRGQIIIYMSPRVTDSPYQDDVNEE